MLIKRLDDRAAALAVADRVLVVLGLDQEAVLLQPVDDGDARFVDGQALERTSLGVHRAVEIDHGHERQVVPPADLEVVRIVRRGHLDRAGAE